MYKLQFTLKQHTPLIHFQHDQEGATLRATEVKPKLDRFIIKELGLVENGKPKEEYKHWFINEGKQHLALDYKMRVENIGQRDENQKFDLYEDTQEQEVKKRYKMRGNYPMVLANMTGQPLIQDLKDSIVYDRLKCTIISFDLQLRDYIKGLIVEFFATTNFGNRSNKGFGSYTISKLEQEAIAWEHNILATNTHYLEMVTTESRKVMEIIDYFYKWLKSGVNYSWFQSKCHAGRYEKSLLFQYLDNSTATVPPKFSWEKRWLKEEFLGLAPLTPTNNPKFARGVLGLSDIFTFTQAKCHTTGIDAPAIQNKQGFKKEIHKAHLGGEIERIKSPITFKPVKIDNYTTHVYLLIDDEHIEQIYTSGMSLDFLFSESGQTNFQTDYTIGNQTYHIHYKLGQGLFIFDEHIERLQRQNNNYLLMEKLKEIRRFKASIKTLPLPDAKIDLGLLFQFVRTNYPTFEAKYFNWTNIINQPITILTT